MKKIFILTAVFFITLSSVKSQQVILSNDTAACGTFNDTLYALSSELSGIAADDGHSGVVDLGFTFNFYGQPYNQIVISGNGYLTFDLSQANQYSPYSINTPIPNPGSMPENAIMCPWHDMNPTLGGSITFGTVGIAPNRKFIVTWCGVPMYSCTSLLHTSQVVLYETTDKIEMFLENKPVCSQFNGGNGVQGLVDATSTFFDIVVDPPSVLPRNFPLQWVAVNEAWAFFPNIPANSYTINTIAFVPIIAGITNWYSDPLLTVNIGTGPTLPVNLTSTGVYTYYAQTTGNCFPAAVYDSVSITFNSICFDIDLETDSASCFGNDGVITVTPDVPLPLWDILLFDIDGNAQIGGQVLNYTGTSYSFQSLEPDTYVVVVTTSDGLAQDTIILGQEQNLLTYQSSIIEPYCLGNDGVITISPDQQLISNPWDISVSNIIGDTLQLVNGLSTSVIDFDNMLTGEYIISILDSDGCLFIDTVDLTQIPNPLIMQTNVSHVSCNGLSDGEIGVFLDNGLLPYTFYINGVENLNPPPYDSLFTGLSEGVYIITVADSDSCGLVETINISAPQFPLQVLSANSVTICDNSSQGSAIAEAAGGTPFSDGSYAYEWYTANGIIPANIIGTGDSISNLAIGDYFLEVTDSNGCQANMPITVSTPQLPLFVTPQLFGVVCTGDASGSAIVFTGGGYAPYDYEWSELNGAVLETVNDITTSDTISGLVAGFYQLLITDDVGCTEEFTFNVDEPNVALEIASVLVVDSVDCYGDLNGRALVNMVPFSGAPAYNYLWDNGETTFIANSLSGSLTASLSGNGGWHTVHVSDSRGCTVVDSVLIPENTQIKSSLSITDSISCFGDNDGLISVITQGGYPSSTSPFYEYFWSTGDVGTLFIDSLFFGSYYVTTRDDLGCVVVDSITLSEPAPLYVNAQEVLEVSCNGFSTGTAYAVGVGGTQPYTFTWVNNGLVSIALDSSVTEYTLFSGLETVSLEDDRGCIATDTVMINQPEPLVVTISDSTLAYCVGVNTASATAYVVGGTAPYTYEWDDNSVFPQTTSIASNLDAGVYMVTVTDYRGCVASVSVDLTQVTSVMGATIESLSTLGNNVSCYNSTDGILTVEVTAGTLPYTYQWFGPPGSSTNDTIFNLSAGIYSVTVTDDNGCTVNTTQELTSPDPLLYKVLSSADALCLGACDGELSLYVEGGVTPYSAILLNNQTGVTSSYSVDINGLVSGVCTGDYTVLLQDANSCDGSLILGGNDQAVLDTTITTDVSVAVQQDIDCYGDSTGVVGIIGSVNLNHTYVWEDLSGNVVNPNALLAGDYILYASYANNIGCTTLDTITVSQNSLIYSTSSVTDVSCDGDNDGSIVTSTFGGTGSYTYSWSPISSLSNSVINVPAGSYSLTITDGSNCSVTEAYVVTEPAPLSATVTASQTYILNTSVSGGTSPYFYSWIEQSQPGVELGVSDSYVVGSGGIYYVVVTDNNGCESQSNSTTFVQTAILDLASLQDLSIYPNPFRNETTVDFGRVVEDAKITVVDIYGKVIEKYEINDTDKYIIKRATKASGVYFLEVEIGNTRINTKIIIK